MAAKRRDKSKDRTVPIPQWWLTQAASKLAHRGWTQSHLVEEAKALRPPVEDASIDKGSVSRLLRGERTTSALAEAVRRVLDLPPFEFFAADGDEAWLLVRVQSEHRKRRGSRSPASVDPIRDLEHLEGELEQHFGIDGQVDVVQRDDVSSGGQRKVQREGSGRGGAA